MLSKPIYKEFTLGELIEVKHGYAFPGALFSDKGEKIIVTPGNFFEHGGFKYKQKEKYFTGDFPNEYLLKKGDLAVAMTEQMEGLLGSTLIVPIDNTFLHNQRIGLIEIKKPELVNKDYLYYLFNTKDVRKQISVMATGTKIRHTSPTSIKKVKVLIPNIVTQEVFAKILGDIDRKIELNRRMHETLQQISQTLFKKYFVINQESEGWDIKPLDEVADFKNGLACQKYPTTKGDQTLRVIKIREMSSGFTSNSDVVGSSFPSDYIIENGDLLFAWSGTLMTKIWSEGPGALNQHIFKVTSDEYPKWFYYQWVNEHLERFVMIAKSKAVTMGHIKRSHLSEVNVKIPPKTYLERFDGLLSSLLEQQTSIAVENNTLISLRDNLLPKLMSGEIRV